MAKKKKSPNGETRVKRNKYHNKKVTIDGITFDSQVEAKRYLFLKEQQSRGIINSLCLQQEFVLIPKQCEESTEVYTKGKRKGQLKDGKTLESACKYKADFTYYKDEKFIVEDVKGVQTKEFKIKKKLFLYKFGIPIKIISEKEGNLYEI